MKNVKIMITVLIAAAMLIGVGPMKTVSFADNAGSFYELRDAVLTGAPEITLNLTSGNYDFEDTIVIPENTSVTINAQAGMEIVLNHQQKSGEMFFVPETSELRIYGTETEKIIFRNNVTLEQITPVEENIPESSEEAEEFVQETLEESDPVQEPEAVPEEQSVYVETFQVVALTEAPANLRGIVAEGRIELKHVRFDSFVTSADLPGGAVSFEGTAEKEGFLSNVEFMNNTGSESSSSLYAGSGKTVVLESVTMNGTPVTAENLYGLYGQLSADGSIRVEEPTAEEPAAEELAAEEPAAEEPAEEEPVEEEPVEEEPVEEEHVEEEPAAEEPVAEEPTVEEPAEEPAVEEPAVEEPAAEEPAVQELPIEEQPVMMPVTQSSMLFANQEEYSEPLQQAQPLQEQQNVDAGMAPLNNEDEPEEKPSETVYDTPVQMNQTPQENRPQQGDNVDKTPKQSIVVGAAWNDNGNSAKRRPSTVQVNLYLDGALYLNASLSAANNWTYVFQNLPSGKSYRIEQTGIADYSTSYSVSGNSVYLNNTYTGAAAQQSQQQTYQQLQQQTYQQPQQSTSQTVYPTPTPIVYPNTVQSTTPPTIKVTPAPTAVPYTPSAVSPSVSPILDTAEDEKETRSESSALVWIILLLISAAIVAGILIYVNKARQKREAQERAQARARKRAADAEAMRAQAEISRGVRKTQEAAEHSRAPEYRTHRDTSGAERVNPERKVRQSDTADNPRYRRTDTNPQRSQRSDSLYSDYRPRH